MVEGKSFRLADEARYIQRRAADRHGRVVTVGQLVLFSTETGDAWLLDPSDQRAARLDLTLKAAALNLSYVIEAEFDRVVDPAKMVRPYVATANEPESQTQPLPQPKRRAS